MKKGTVLTLYFFNDNDKGYAEVEFVKKKRNGDYQFCSTTYGHFYYVSADMTTITLQTGNVTHVYQADTSMAWYCQLKAAK